MREWFVGQGAVMYVFAACTVVGLVSALVANYGYKRMIKETEMMGNTQNRLLKYIKLKFGSYYKLNMKPQDTQALARHYMYKQKVGIMNVMTWLKISKLAVGILVLSTLGSLIWMIQSKKTWTEMLSLLLAGTFCISVLSMQQRIYDFGGKQEMLLWHLMDYLENFLKNKIESGKNLGQMAAAQAEEKEMQKVPEKTLKKGADEAAAARVSSLFSEPKPGHFYGSDAYEKWPRRYEDEMDAKVVEDVLKEFLT